MKQVWIKDISSIIGEEIQDNFMVTAVDLNRNTGGKTWINCKISDRTGTNEAVIWNECIKDDTLDLKGKVIKAQGQINVLNSNPRLQISHYEIVDDYEIEDFIYKMNEEILEEYKKRLNSLIMSVKECRLNLLLRTVYREKFIDLLCTRPGGLVHHAYNGGLLVHIVEVGENASFMCELDERAKDSKSYHVPVKRDLCVTGALLSDIGKVEEYTPYPFCTLTESAYMVGHAMVSVKLIDNFIRTLMRHKPELNYSDIQVDLENIVLSAHSGGGKASPRSKEAIIACNADSNSADVSAYDAAIEHYIKSGKVSNEPFINSSYFKHKILKGGDMECDYTETNSLNEN